MQTILRVSGANALQNPLLGNRMSYRVAPAPAPRPTATREVVCMAKKKGVRIIVTLECTEARGEGSTPSRYVSQKVRHTVAAAGCHVSELSCSSLPDSCAFTEPS
jgi:large subunit ribosomal protein L33